MALSIRKKYLFLLIIVLITALYYPSLFAPFNSIDDGTMVNHILNLDSFSLYKLFFPSGSGQYYRPVVYLTFLADSNFWGLIPSFMHLENILLHVACTLLVFELAGHFARQIDLHSDALPLASSLLFGLHPLAAEPVNWVSGRTDLLAGLFVLASFLLFLRSLHNRSYWVAATGAMLLLAGCLSKETALFMLPVMILWCLLAPKDWGCSASPVFRLFLIVWYSSAGATYLVLRRLALSGGDKVISTIAVNKGTTGVSFAMWDIARTVLKTSGFYFKKLIIPVPLNFGIVEISPHYLWLGLLVIAGICWCVYLRTTVAYLFFLAFCLVSPAFFLPLLKMTWTPVAERYVYIAMAPFVIALSLLFVRYVQPRLTSWVISLGIAILLGSAGVVTAQRNIIWQDNYTLFEDTLKKSPNSAAAKNELAIALRDRGKTNEAYALLLSNREDDIRPTTLNKVRVYVQKGQYEDAKRILTDRRKRGVADDPESLNLFIDIDEHRIGMAKTANDKKAINRQLLEYHQKLLFLTGDPFYHYRIGMIQLRLGDKRAARTSFYDAWQKSSTNAHYHDAARKLTERLSES